MSTTILTIYTSLLRSIGEFKVIWPQLIIFQIYARILQYIGFFGISLIGFNSILKPGITSISLSNFDLLNALDPKKAIIAIFLISIVSIAGFFYEYLGLIFICRAFHRGEPISLKKTLSKTFLVLPRFIRVILLQFAIVIGILSFAGLIGLTFWSLLTYSIAVIAVILVCLGTIVFVWNTFMKLTYVAFRVFNKNKSFYGMFDYQLNKKQLLELNIFTIIVILITLAGVFFGGLLINGAVSATTLITSSIILLSGITGLIIAISLFVSTVFSMLFMSIVTLYRSRVYHTEFSSITIHAPNTHDYDYESRAVRIWMKHKKLILGFTTVLVILGVTLQSLKIKDTLFIYIDNDFLTIAHRGGSTAPENTLETIQTSIDEGIDMIEVDLQLTLDNQIVIFHDENLEKVGSNKIVHFSNLDELNQLSFPTGEKIPTLTQILKQTKNKIGLNLELKIYDDRQGQFLNKLVEALKQHESNQKLLITSLDYSLLEKVEQYNSNIDTGFIITASVENLDTYKSDYLIVNDLFYQSRKQMFNLAQKPIILWSFSSSFDGNLAFENGLAGGITDQPKILQDIETEFEQLSFNQKLRKFLIWTVL
jgi:glycerophosphoryl diester phosphodiesterase